MLEIIPHESAHADHRPLPLIVAEKWSFTLDFVQEEGVYWFNIQDWIVGLLQVDSQSAAKIWNDVQRRSALKLSDSIRRLPYLAANGKKYMMDHTVDKGLYLIAQHLRAALLQR